MWSSERKPIILVWQGHKNWRIGFHYYPPPPSFPTKYTLSSPVLHRCIHKPILITRQKPVNNLLTNNIRHLFLANNVARTHAKLWWDIYTSNLNRGIVYNYIILSYRYQLYSSFMTKTNTFGSPGIYIFDQDTMIKN